MNSASFATQIRERYPEGLTGIFAIGGTRTAYLLDHRDQLDDPGKIADYDVYMDYALDLTMGFMRSFFDLGGQNMVIALFSYQGFYERGPEYAAQAAGMCLRTINDAMQAFYREYEVDPYFAGIDTLLHLPENTTEHQLGVAFEQFHQTWPYQDGRRKVIWEVAPIPLFSFWKAHQVMGETAHAELDAELEGTTNMSHLYDVLYKYYARATYGTDIPMPHFYLGTNRNGDLKLRAVLPIALLCGGAFRLYYTPYPSLYTTAEAMQGVLEDLAFGKAMRSFKADYAGQYTPELVEAEYQRVLDLTSDPLSTVGLTRKVVPQP